MPVTNFYITKNQKTQKGALRLDSEKLVDGTNYVYLEDDVYGNYGKTFLRVEAEDVLKSYVVERKYKKIKGKRTEFYTYLVSYECFTPIAENSPIIDELLPSLIVLKEKFLPNVNRILKRQHMGEFKDKDYYIPEDAAMPEDEKLYRAIRMLPEDKDLLLNIEDVYYDIYKTVTSILNKMRDNAGHNLAKLDSLTCCLSVFELLYKANRKDLAMLCPITEEGGLHDVFDCIPVPSKKVYTVIKKYIYVLLCMDNYDTLIAELKTAKADQIPLCFTQDIKHLFSIEKTYKKIRSEDVLAFTEKTNRRSA